MNHTTLQEIFLNNFLFFSYSFPLGVSFSIISFLFFHLIIQVLQMTQELAYGSLGETEVQGSSP